MENLSKVDECEPVRHLTRKGCFFDKFVVAEFACKPALSLNKRMCMVCESSLGRTIKHLDRGERIGFVQEALGGKAYATLKARANGTFRGVPRKSFESRNFLHGKRACLAARFPLQTALA